MKATTPTVPPIKTGGDNGPDWLIIVYAIGTMILIYVLAYIAHRFYV